MWFRKKKKEAPIKKRFEVTHFYQHLILYRKLNGLFRSQSPYMNKIEQSASLYSAIRKAMETKEETLIDNFVHSITFRAEVLNSGFKTLLESGNYLCASSLTRMQADSILTCLAGLACNDRDKFFRVYNEVPEESGKVKVLNQLKDKHGNQLTNNYLIKVFEGDPLFSEVFRKGNKYIHPTKVFQDASKGFIAYKDYHSTQEEISHIEETMIYLNNILANVLVRWILLKHGIDVGVEFATPELIAFAYKWQKEEERFIEEEYPTQPIKVRWGFFIIITL